MIRGDAGIGRSALILKVVNELSKVVAARCIRLRGMKDLRDLLTRPAVFYEAGDHSLRRKLRAQGLSAATFGAWLTTSSSSRLRGTLYHAVDKGDYGIILDDCHP